MRSTLAIACALGLAATVSACAPGTDSDSETLLWSSLTLDSAGKTIMKRDVITRAELRMRREARDMMRTGALKPEGAAAHIQAAGERLVAAGVGYVPLPKYDWLYSHWLWRIDMGEVIEFMPSTIPGVGDLGFWAYSDGTNGRNSIGYESGVHSGTYCQNNQGPFGCSGASWQFPPYIYSVPFEVRDFPYLQLNN